MYNSEYFHFCEAQTYNDIVQQQCNKNTFVLCTGIAGIYRNKTKVYKACV